ncbi:hypothetical protein Tco_0699440 [Tanacetum coccineum]
MSHHPDAWVSVSFLDSLFYLSLPSSTALQIANQYLVYLQPLMVPFSLTQTRPGVPMILNTIGFFLVSVSWQYDRRVNKRLMKIQESMIDSSKELDADLVVTESSKTGSEVQYDSIKSANDTDVDDADIRPIYNEEPMAEVQLTVKCNIFAIGQQLTEQPKIINEGRVDQYPE